MMAVPKQKGRHSFRLAQIRLPLTRCACAVFPGFIRSLSVLLKPLGIKTFQCLEVSVKLHSTVCNVNVKHPPGRRITLLRHILFCFHGRGEISEISTSCFSEWHTDAESNSSVLLVKLLSVLFIT